MKLKYKTKLRAMRILFLSIMIITTQANFASIASAIEDFFTNDETGGFDHDFPRMLESMILNGEIQNHIEPKVIEKMIDPMRGQKQWINSSSLTDLFNFTNLNFSDANETMVMRPCDEFIFAFTPEEMRALMRGYFSLILGDGSPLTLLFNSYIDLRYKFGFAAYKICASCAELRPKYGGMGTFDSYCGEGKHGADVNVSGLLYIPVDENKDFQDCDSNLAVWHRYLEWRPEDCPSEQFIDSTKWGNEIEDFEAVGFTYAGFLTAGIGIVTLLPDYLGYGESYHVMKGPGVNSIYQIGSVPLILKARDTFVEQITGGKTKLTNYIITSGYSEGAQSAVATGVALDDLGIGLRVRTQAGGGAFDQLSNKGVLHFIGKKLTYKTILVLLSKIFLTSCFLIR